MPEAFFHLAHPCSTSRFCFETKIAAQKLSGYPFVYFLTNQAAPSAYMQLDTPKAVASAATKLVKSFQRKLFVVFDIII